MRTILFLINGFGIENKDSYSVYNAELMPNFEKLINRYIFSSVESNLHSVYEGYRNMSLEINELYNYHIFNRELANNNLFNNDVYNNIVNELNTREKAHLFCFVDTSPSIVDNLKEYLKKINPNHDKKIFLHLVLTPTNYEDYPMILEVLSKINIDLNEYATIGLVLGLEYLLNSNPLVELNFLLKMLITEVGEKWQSFKQKLDVSYGTKKAPSSVKPFVVNNGFSLGNNDLCLIWNYDNIDISNYINGIKNINYNDKTNNIVFYSLFPVTYEKPIPYMLNYETSPISLSQNMKGLSFKTLVLTQADTVTGINYYLNGLSNNNNTDITYIAIDNCQYDTTTLLNILNSYKQDFVIMNYDISSSQTIEELKDQLSKIDAVLGSICTYMETNSLSLIISSLYKINKNLNNDSGEICHVFYSKSPLIYVNNFASKKDYLINEGKTNDLFRLCYKTINKDYPGGTILIKKNFLYRMIYK